METFKDRLAHILRSKNLTGTQFAGLMGIQPSNVSHLLSGRNNPSLDFLVKLKETFPEYSFDWIILGKKPITMVEPCNAAEQPEILNQIEKDPNIKLDFGVAEENDASDDSDQSSVIDEITEKLSFSADNQNVVINKHDFHKHDDRPKKILIMYEDNTFEVYNSRRQY